MRICSISNQKHTICYIGEEIKMAVLVREVMIKDPVTLKDTATIGEAVEVFAEKGVG